MINLFQWLWQIRYTFISDLATSYLIAASIAKNFEV